MINPIYPEVNMDHFHRMRPKKGNAFYCMGDVISLVELHTNGKLPMESDTNARSRDILLKGELICGGAKSSRDYRLTEKGRAVIERILNMPIEG